jgi:hypothetical protein
LLVAVVEDEARQRRRRRHGYVRTCGRCYFVARESRT